MKNSSLAEIAAMICSLGGGDSLVTGFQVHSSNVQPGNLFFALKGNRKDGHDFLQEVAERGACGAVVSKEYQGKSFGLILLPVEDVLQALQSLAKETLARRKVPVVALTGSVGKTTTREFIATLLKGKFRVGKNHENYNSQIGLPLTILNSSGEEEVFVLEMAMNQEGQLRKLVQIAPPDIALITKVSFAHAENFKRGLEGIAEAKCEIFSQEKTKVAIFNHQLLQFPYLGSFSGEKISFSIENPKAEYFLCVADERIHVDERGLRAKDFSLPFKEMHLVEDFLAAVAVARALKMSWEEIDAQVGLLTPFKMRFEKIEKDGILYINDAYNASPESIKAALMSLPEPKPGGRKIAVLGEMREMGPFSFACHEEVGKFALNRVDHLLCLGKACAPMYALFLEAKKPAELFECKDRLFECLEKLIAPGDVVLIKGARSLALEKVLERLLQKEHVVNPSAP